MRRALVGAVVALALLGVAACSGPNDPVRPSVQRGIEYSPGLHLDLYHPVRGVAPLPVVVLIHGGSFLAGSRLDLTDYAEALAERGYVTATIDYRLATAGKWFPATELTAPDLVAAALAARQDAQQAIQWLVAHAAEERLDPGHLAVVGYSAGAITAIEVATHGPPAVQAAVSISGAAIDLAALAQPHPPLLLLHGTGDAVIAPALAEQTCAVAVAVCQLQEFPAVGHDLVETKRLQILNAIDTFLGGPRRSA